MNFILYFNRYSYCSKSWTRMWRWLGDFSLKSLTGFLSCYSFKSWSGDSFLEEITSFCKLSCLCVCFFSWRNDITWQTKIVYMTMSFRWRFERIAWRILSSMLDISQERKKENRGKVKGLKNEPNQSSS